MNWGLVMPASLSRDLRERIVAAISWVNHAQYSLGYGISNICCRSFIDRVLMFCKPRGLCMVNGAALQRRP